VSVPTPQVPVLAVPLSSGGFDIAWHYPDSASASGYTDMHMQFNPAGEVGPGKGQVFMCGGLPAYDLDGAIYLPRGGTEDDAVGRSPDLKMAGSGVKPFCGDWNGDGNPDLGWVANEGTDHHNAFHFRTLSYIPVTKTTPAHYTLGPDTVTRFGYWTPKPTGADQPLIGHWTRACHGPLTPLTATCDTQGVRRNDQWHLATDRSHDIGDIGFTTPASTSSGAIYTAVGDWNATGIDQIATITRTNTGSTWAIEPATPTPNQDNINTLTLTPTTTITWTWNNAQPLPPNTTYLAG
jgi:hypothetical protein